MDTPKIVSDYPDGGYVQLEVSGKIQALAGNTICIITPDFDIETIGELINACGYTSHSLVGRRVTITIQEDELFDVGE